VVNGGGRQEQVRLANCFRAFVKPYVSCGLDSDSDDAIGAEDSSTRLLAHLAAIK
jgi:hypothetical protein